MKVVTGFSQAPSIVSFSPLSASAGSTVTITGAGFSATPASNIVYFGAARATVVTASPGVLTVTVPATASWAPISVTTGGLTAYSPRSFDLVFSGGGGAINFGSFAIAKNFQTDLHPNGLVLVDLDGDGKLDLATPNNYITGSSPSSVSILRNIGSGGNPAFAPVVNLPNGQQTNAIASADFNGDGLIDLAVTSNVARTLSVFVNNSVAGNIRFAPKIDLPTGRTPSYIAVADIDGDGKPDVAVVNALENSLSIFQNTSSGGVVSFASRVDLPTGLYPCSVAAGDVDGDGKPDLVVANNLSNSVSLYRNTSSPGTVSLASAVDWPTTSTGDNPYHVVLADLEGDGHPDMIVSNSNLTTVHATTANFSVFRNMSSSGSFSFGSRQDFASGFAQLIGVGDLNGDGKPDLVIPDYTGTQQTYIWQNTSVSGTITLASGAPVFVNAPYASGIGDLDGDGLPDLAISNFTYDNVSVLHNRMLEPNVSNISPMTAAAGATITITGTNLSGVSSISIGEQAVASYTVVSDSKITAVVGSGNSGDIKISNSHGTYTYAGFVFAGPAAVTSFTPASAGNGDTVTIVGHNFNGTTGVVTGGVQTNYVVVTPDTLRIYIGPGATGSIAITTPYGTTTVPGFTWLPRPVLGSFAPTSAGLGGQVTLHGSYLAGAMAVTFGGVPAQSFSVVDPNTIVAVVGAGASGDVVVTTPYGQSASHGFGWLPAPAVGSVSPMSGITGTVLTINGDNFDYYMSVKIGGFGYTYTFVSPQQITVTLDSRGASGDIVITGGGGTVTVPGFIFYKVPSVGAISPVVAGPGMTITITGTDFVGVSAVTLGGVPAASYNVVSPTTITAVVGNGASGSVYVTNPAGKSYSNAALTYSTAPLVNSYTPDRGPAGTVVTISGWNFGADDVVWFGAEKASPLSVSNNTLTVAVPAGATYGPLYVAATGTMQMGSCDHPFMPVSAAGPAGFDAQSLAGHHEFRTGIGPSGVAIGDLDSDGQPDIAVANISSGSVSLFRNISKKGNIDLEARQDVYIGGDVRNVSLVDVDGDGKLDIIAIKGNEFNCSGCGDRGLYIFRNLSTSGKFQFDQPVYIPTFQKLDHIAVGDINGDGRPDIVGADGSLCISCNWSGTSPNLFLFFNNSTAGKIDFQGTEYTVSHDAYYANVSAVVNGIAIRDLDGDGRADIVFGEAGGNFVLVLPNRHFYPLNLGSELILGTAYPALADRSYPVVADFDGDGQPDILTSGSYFKNKGNYAFTNQNNVSAGGPVATADLDGDGKLDVIRTGQQYLDSMIYVYRDSAGGSPAPLGGSLKYPALAGVKQIVVGDLDGDGKPEIVVSNARYNSISVFRNRAGEPLPGMPTIVGVSPGSATYADTISISGTNFDEASSVSIGGMPVVSYKVVSSNTIRAVVDTGATGLVVVTTPAGSASYGQFTYLAPKPAIYGVSPSTALPGTSVVISGIGFDGTTAVSFGGIPARRFTVVGTTTIIAIVDSAVTDTITVSTPAGIAEAGGFTLVGTPSIGGDRSACMGQATILVASGRGGSCQWYRNGVVIAGSAGDTLRTDSAGLYTVSRTINGVSSPLSAVDTLTLRAGPPQPVITILGDSLVSSAQDGNQWYQDTTTAVDRATGQYYKPDRNGRYSLRVKRDGCPSPFASVVLFTMRVDSADGVKPVRFGPNPATDFVVINFDLPGHPVVTVQFFDANGQEVIQKADNHSGDRIGIARLQRGIYYVRVSLPEGDLVTVVKIFKL